MDHNTSFPSKRSQDTTVDPVYNFEAKQDFAVDFHQILTNLNNLCWLSGQNVILILVLYLFRYNSPELVTLGCLKT